MDKMKKGWLKMTLTAMMHYSLIIMTLPIEYGKIMTDSSELL